MKKTLLALYFYLLYLTHPLQLKFFGSFGIEWINPLIDKI